MLYNNSYKEIALQCRRPNYQTEWCTVSLENQIPGKGMTEVNDLHVGDCFEFRGLFEDGSDIVFISTEKSVTIEGNFTFNVFKII